MQAHLDTFIKELMDRHPALGTVLTEAGIGCTSCSLGSCRIKDILEIHDLDTEQTRQLLTRMGEIIYAGAPFDVPDIQRQTAEPRSGFCPPIARMVEEHTHIKRLIALTPRLIQALQSDFDAAAPWLIRGLDFIRTYADRYHHAKEEDILFGYFNPESDILKVMLRDHDEGRAHVMAVAEGLASRDLQQISRHLIAYGELLSGHIHREDSILYPWMDRSLSTRQVGELFGRCLQVEREFGDLPAIQEAFVAELERHLD